MRTAPPCGGSHPAPKVGRLSESHSDIGFQLTQFPGGRKVEKRKVKKVGWNSGLTLFSNALENDRTLSAAAKRQWRGFVGSIVNHHGIKKGKMDSVSNSFLAGTRSDVSDRIP